MSTRLDVTTDGHSSQTLMDRAPDAALTIPIRIVDRNSPEGLVTGFQTGMLDLGPGSVSTGAGLGNDFIRLKWEDHLAVVRGSELLKAWVATLDPEVIKQFPVDIQDAPAP